LEEWEFLNWPNFIQSQKQRERNNEIDPIKCWPYPQYDNRWNIRLWLLWGLWNDDKMVRKMVICQTSKKTCRINQISIFKRIVREPTRKERDEIVIEGRDGIYDGCGCGWYW